jgi:hypothetical protein
VMFVGAVNRFNGIKDGQNRKFYITYVLSQ